MESALNYNIILLIMQQGGLSSFIYCILVVAMEEEPLKEEFFSYKCVSQV